MVVGKGSVIKLIFPELSYQASRTIQNGGSRVEFFPQYHRWFKDETYFPLPDDGRTMEKHDPDIDKLCVMCDEHGSTQCGRCHARYCSTKCQDKDWPIHKAICRDMAGSFAPSERPSHGAHRMLLFPIFKSQPELVWVESGDEAPGDEVDANISSVLTQEFPDNIPLLRLSNIVINYSIPFRRCGHTLHLMCAGTYVQSDVFPDSDDMNQSVMRLSPNPGHTMIHHGAFIVFSDRQGMLDDNYMLDITARDVRSVVDFFLSMKLSPCIPDPSRYPASFYDCEIWPAIKINCDVDIQRLAPFLPHGQEVLPRRPNTNLGISTLGLCKNVEARWFGFDGNPDESYALASTEKRDHDAGTVIVSHANGAKIHPLHVQWLDAWVTEKLMTNRMSGEGFIAMVDPLRKYMEKAKNLTDEELSPLTQHWNEFLEKNGHDPEKSDVVSPWDV
ncbi:hypothetical protein PG994_006582 [Apiospora phragmitis]|uniref:MYND-type domain-containing protein n=1 Tax=Apiospora phragmitis TaxID=2905665 RepID=A0ABR1VI47_9PEZI